MCYSGEVVLTQFEVYVIAIKLLWHLSWLPWLSESMLPEQQYCPGYTLNLHIHRAMAMRLYSELNEHRVYLVSYLI